MTIDCDTCFNKRYYPPQAIANVCEFCKGENMRFYKPDYTDLTYKKIVNIITLKENEK